MDFIKKICLITLLLLCFISAFSIAEEEGRWYEGAVIGDIRFIGLKTIKFKDLESVVYPYIGQKYSDKLFTELQTKIYALDYFRKTVINAVRDETLKNPLVIEFRVEERFIINEINFEGNQKVSKSDLLDSIILKKGDFLSITKLRLDEKGIRDLYLEKGFLDAKISSDVKEDEKNNEAAIIFTIDEGPQSTINEIKFVGNRYASESTLKREMETKEQKFLRKGIYQENVLKNDRERIKHYYWNRGFIDAKIEDVEIEEKLDTEEGKRFLTVTIYINEGERFIYAGIKFEGNQIFKDEKLLELVKQKEGKFLNKEKLERDYMRIQDLYFENGYIFNRFDRKEIRDEVKKEIAYLVRVQENNRAHIQNIIIKGNTKTKDRVIKRELPFDEGDVFSKKKIVDGLRNLYNLQYFNTVEPETPIGSEEGLIDLVINVEEGKTADISFGLMVSGDADFPISGQVKFADKNFLGNGQTFGVDCQVSPIKQDLSFNFAENWLFGRRWAGGVDFSFTHELIQDEPQDRIGIIYNNDDYAQPDPYSGYVFARETEYNGTVYPAGAPFPGAVSPAIIDQYNLETEYAHNNYSIPDDFLMEYHLFELSLGLNTGYTKFSRVGRLGVSTGLSSTLSYILYDADIYRPYNKTTRNNLGNWDWVNRWWVSASWDTRDLVYNPSKGFLFKQQFTLAGGFLQGDRHYIRSNSKAQGYLTLFDIPIVDEFSLKAVLKAHSAISFIFPQFGRKEIEATQSDLLYLDGMFTARGWPIERNGKVLWDNKLEIRMPIVESILWHDIIFDAAALWQDINHEYRHSFTDISINDFRFSFGWGLRLAMPQFPLGFYFVKRFQFIDNQFHWAEDDDLFESLGGLSLVVTLGIDLF